MAGPPDRSGGSHFSSPYRLPSVVKRLIGLLVPVPAFCGTFDACEIGGVPAVLAPAGVSVSHPKERLDGHAA